MGMSQKILLHQNAYKFQIKRLISEGCMYSLILTLVSRIGHAIVRLRTAKTTGGPVTAYTYKPSPISPALGDAITTVHLTEGGDQYYEWNISEYASQNTGGKLTVVFGIAPSNVAIHSFTSLLSGSPGELLIHTGPID